jgi:hypothetical protein
MRKGFYDDGYGLFQNGKSVRYPDGEIIIAEQEAEDFRKTEL